MIDLHYWTTPNRHKVTTLREEPGKFLPTDTRSPAAVMPWLFWQMGGLGPMARQNHHFVHYAPETLPYAINRYVNETNRLYGVLNERLANREFVAGDYSIADMLSYPRIVPHKRQQRNFGAVSHRKSWFETIHARRAVQRTYAQVEKITPTVSEQSRLLLFDQTAANRTGVKS
jgi:GST-like protein